MKFFVTAHRLDHYLSAEIRTPSGKRVTYWTTDRQEAKTYQTLNAARKAANRVGGHVVDEGGMIAYAGQN